MLTTSFAAHIQDIYEVPNCAIMVGVVPRLGHFHTQTGITQGPNCAHRQDSVRQFDCLLLCYMNLSGGAKSVVWTL